MESHKGIRRGASDEHYQGPDVYEKRRDEGEGLSITSWRAKSKNP